MRTAILTIFLSVCCLGITAQVSDVQKGDVLVVNGVKGIVLSVDDSGCHGTMMSVKAFRGTKNLFCSKPSLLKNISMSSTTDGKANTEELFAYVEANNLSLSDSPVFNWCKSLGYGWYVPSIEQLKTFVNYWLGQDDLEVDGWGDEEETVTDEEDSVDHTKKVNRILMDAGGIPFLNGVFSSTLSADKKVDVFDYDKESGSFSFSSKKLGWVGAYSAGRAFYDF